MKQELCKLFIFSFYKKDINFYLFKPLLLGSLFLRPEPNPDILEEIFKQRNIPILNISFELITYKWTFIHESFGVGTSPFL